MDAIHREGDRHVEAPGPEEITVHGVRCSLGSQRALCRDEGLGEHLTTEHATVGLPLAVPRKNVFTCSRPSVSQIQCGEKSGQWVTHAL